MGRSQDPDSTTEFASAARLRRQADETTQQSSDTWPRGRPRGRSSGQPMAEPRHCVTCGEEFRPTAGSKSRRCGLCKARERTAEQAAAANYQPAFRGPLPEPSAGHAEPRADTGRRGGHPGGGISPHALMFAVFPGLTDGRYSVQTETQAGGLRWFGQQSGADTVAGPFQGGGRRFDIDVDEQTVYRLAHLLGLSLRADPRGLMVRDRVQVQWHAEASQVMVLAASLRIHTEIMGGLVGADFGSDAQALTCGVAVRAGMASSNDREGNA